MNTIYKQLFIMLILLLLFSGNIKAKAASSGPKLYFEPQISNPYIEYKSGGEMMVSLKLWGDNFAPSKRRPVNLVLVIDESGSMNERGKMNYAKQAAKDLVSKLNSNDRVGIVTYSDYSRVILPLQRLTNKRLALRVIDSIEPTNSTNLSAGLIEGISQLKYNDRNGYINKLILLSDGLANRGITDIRSLSRIASRSAEGGIYITTMGLGLNYDEDLMMAIADCGSGNYYFIESPDQMAFIFDREFERTTSTIAKDIVIEIYLGKNVELMELYGYNYEWEGRKIRMNIGNMFSGQERNIKMRLRVPDDKQGENTLMTSAMTYRDVIDNNSRQVDKKVEYTVTASREKVVKNEKKEIVSDVKSAEAAKDLDEATRNYESGDRQSALSKIKEALRRVKNMNQSEYKTQKTVEQEEALSDALRSMSSETSPASPAGKSLIKKYKAESREQQR